MIDMAGHAKKHNSRSFTSQWKKSPAPSSTTTLSKKSSPSNASLKRASVRVQDVSNQPKWKGEESWWQMRRALLQNNDLDISMMDQLEESRIEPAGRTSQFSLGTSFDVYGTPSSAKGKGKLAFADIQEIESLHDHERVPQDESGKDNYSSSMITANILVSGVLSEEEQMKLLSASDIHVLKRLLHAGSERDQLSRTARELRAVSKV
jgi:hypothetical protein